MTFEAFEKARQLAAPAELYKFERASLRWYFTSAGADVVHDGFTWVAAAINRTDIQSSTTEDRSEIKITVPRDNPVADLFRVAPPSDVVTASIYRIHVGDTDERAIWVGRILSVDWRGATAALSCEPASASLNRNLLRRVYQRQCPHLLYGAACGVNRASFEVTGTITALSANTVTAAAFGSQPSGYFAGGVLEWTAPTNVIERRMILSHAGSVVTLTQAIPGVQIGASVTVAPGCDRTIGATGCARFSNVPAYGGFPFIPTKNPHGGSPIY